jgi:UDP-N-acetylglucosamine--N-acetylmuramyl-(pentapeptide) pyrophosphoryl-undecaprenol N-acetylglucosamine transferase
MIAARKFNLDPEKKTLLMFGGSQGSVPLNTIVRESIKDVEQYGIQVLWQTGTNQFKELKNFESDSTRILPFIDDMGSAYALADLALCRAGALTISELTLCGLPALFVPLSSAAGDHQQKNASVMGNAGAAIICNENEFTTDVFVNHVSELMKDEDRLSKMGEQAKKLAKPDAVREITNHIMELAA